MMRGLAVCSLALIVVADGSTTSTIKMFSVSQEVVQAGDGREPQQQVADLGLGLGSLYPGSRVWLDLEESAWSKIPGWLVGTILLVPSSVIHGTKQVLWDCAAEEFTGQPHCEIYTFMYSCMGCPFETGDFQTLMGNEGFEMFRCAPSVMSRTGGGEHHMIGFFKTIDAGTTLTIDITAATTEFVTFGLNPHPAPLCSTLDETACVESNDKCAVFEMGCDFTRQCVKTPYGPGPSIPCTDLCINDDL